MSINLLPWRASQKAKLFQHVTWIVLLILSCECAIAFFLKASIELKIQSSARASQVTQLAINKIPKNPSYLKDKTLLLQLKKLRHLKNISKNSNKKLALLLHHITQYLPNTLSFTELNKTIHRLIIRGKGSNLQDIQRYSDLLQKKFTRQHVLLESISGKHFSEDKNISFSIRIIT